MFHGYNRLPNDPALLMLIYFFFECYGHHRDLHSFPTRRSSDLRRTAGWKPALHRSITARPFSAPSAPAWRRSEEHTSELQSRQYLVCRLLLEKKKKIAKKQNVNGRHDVHPLKEALHVGTTSALW